MNTFDAPNSTTISLLFRSSGLRGAMANRARVTPINRGGKLNVNNVAVALPLHFQLLVCAVTS